MHRSWILAQREPRISRAKIAQTIIVALFLIPTFWQLNKFANCNSYPLNADGTYDGTFTFAGNHATYTFTTQKDCTSYNAIEIHSMVGATYFLCVMQMFLNFLPTVIVF